MKTLTDMFNTDSKSYLFNLSYGGRMNELKFIIDILLAFDNETLTGVTIFVNNNPYNLEFLLFLSFEKKDIDYDFWLSSNYPNKKVDYLFNYTLSDIIGNLANKRYNCYSFSTTEDAKRVITNEPNFLFLFPSSDLIKNIWGNWEKVFKFKIFLSHSTIDKSIVEKIFLELQKEEIKVWFDKYEISPGDSITDKLNEGLCKSDLGLFCFSKNFMKSSWAQAEMNYFFRQRMIIGKKNFILLNIDLALTEFPPLLQDYKQININNNNWIKEVISVIRDIESKNT